ncbi:MAG TPA: hypothetical protein VIG80_05005 [Bacillaceae bacterium]
MEQITLAEAVKLKSILTRKIHQLEEEMERVAFATVEKGEQAEAGPRTVEAVEQELDEVRKDTRLLDKLMYRANIDHEISFKGENLAIVEAIELATQLRAKARMYKEFGSSAKEEVQFGYSDSTVFYRVALFDPEEYRQKAIQLEKKAHKLSNLINAKNYAIQLEFNGANIFNPGKVRLFSGAWSEDGTP